MSQFEINFIELIKELKLSQHRTDNPKCFEQALAISFDRLGLPTKHLGGPNEPDFLIEFNGSKITGDAKTCQDNPAITEQMIGFPAQKRYRKKYNASKSVIIAPAFRKGNVLTTAKEEDVILVETKTICKILSNHNIFPYKAEEIFNMLFEGGKVMVSIEDVKSSSIEEQKKAVIKIIKSILDLLYKKDLGSFTVKRLQDIFIEKDYQEEEDKTIVETIG